MIYKKYSELDAYIPTLGSGTYELTVDCSGVPAYYLHERYGDISLFGRKFLNIPANGPKFKLWCTNVGSDVTDISYMFYSSRAKKGVECITYFSSSGFTQATKASAMFRGCTSLTSVDTSDFINITKADGMFRGCKSLTSIDISPFKSLSTLESYGSWGVGAMFQDSGITSLNLSSWTNEHSLNGSFGVAQLIIPETCKITKADKLFNGITNMTNETSLSGLLSKYPGCKYLSGLCGVAYGTKITNIRDSDLALLKGPITSWSDLLTGTLKYNNVTVPTGVIDLAAWPIMKNFTKGPRFPKTVTSVKNISYLSNVTDAGRMFEDCTGLTSIDTTAFTQVTNAGDMFYGCSGLTSIDTTAFTQVTNAGDMFYGCSGLTSIDTSGFTQVNDASYMFYGCSGLTSIDTSGFTQVNDASYMFYGCSGLTSIDTTGFTQATKASAMFRGCTSLTSVDTSAFTQVTDAGRMFSGCSGLTSIDTSAFTQVNDASYMFYGCSSLTSIDTSAFTQVRYTDSMFSGCSGLTSIDTSAFTQVTNAGDMFYGCSGLTSIDTTAFTQVRYTDSMFEDCTGLTSITFGVRAITGTDAFSRCPIKTAKVRGPNASLVKTAVIAEAGESFWPTSATWTVEQTKLWKFLRIR